MDERDGLALALIIGAVALVSVMHSRLIGQLYKDQMKIMADVAWLMDHTAAVHETEDR